MSGPTNRFVEPMIFAGVGAVSSLVHFLVGVALIEQAGLEPWLANIGAFSVAFPVSYLGHAFLTFSARAYGRSGAMTGKSFRRFLALAVGGFAINQTSIVVFAQQLGYPHRTVLGLTIIGVAGLLYVVSKFWAFREKAAS